MKRLDQIEDDVQISTGAVFRMFGVKRFDIIKSAENAFDSASKQKDFYDYMIVDIGVIKEGSFIVVNVTEKSGDKGHILSVFEDVSSRNWIKAKILKDYFDNSPDIYFL